MKSGVKCYGKPEEEGRGQRRQLHQRRLSLGTGREGMPGKSISEAEMGMQEMHARWQRGVCFSWPTRGMKSRGKTIIGR